MVLKIIRQAGALGILLLLLAHPADLSSCGPFFPEAVFTRSKSPDNERAFFSGDLGILQPSYERRYLAMAYRLMSGVPLTSAQIASVSDLDRFRRSDTEKALTEWLAARKQVPGTRDLTLDLYRRGSYFMMYPSCGADAFLTAIRTLRELIQNAGAFSAEVRDWLDSQDKVFANCGESSAMPDEAQPGSSERIRADRAYQIAAAEFYSGMFDEARAAFRKIGDDHASPWHMIAPYLIARTYLRQDNYAAARDQLKGILADPQEAGIHRQARSLLDYALARLDPSAQLLAFAKRLMKPDADDLGHDLNDYTFLYDSLESVRPTNRPLTQEEFKTEFDLQAKRLQAVVAQDDLTAWIYALENQGRRQAPNPEERWRSTHSLPWLIAVLFSTGGKPESASELVDAALGVPRNSPAYFTARFEAARLLIEAGKKGQAAQMLDGLLNHGGVSGTSTVNAFRAERMKVARNFEEFIAYAPRTMASVTYDYDSSALASADKQYSKPLSTFDADATSVFNNSLPLGLWLRAIGNRSLAAPLRTELAQSGWVRAVVENDSAAEFARELTVLKSSYSTGLQPYLNAPNHAQQTFEAAYFLLHHPELQPWVRAGIQRQTPDGRIDDFRDNWWCAVNPSTGEPTDQFRYYGMQSIRSQPVAEFLPAEEKQKFETQEEALEKAGSGPEFLSSIAVAWAKSHPDDPRNPETLALAVKSSRFGCPDSNSAHSVEAAFHLLHSRYPKTSWARQTPYWFK